MKMPLLLLTLCSAVCFAEPSTREDPRVAAVRMGIQELRDKAASDRRAPAIWNVTWGAGLTALGATGVAYFGPHRDTTLTIASAAGLAFGLADLAFGLHELSSQDSAEQVAAYLLEDERRIRSAGLVFLYDHAQQARRARIRASVLHFLGAAGKGVVMIPIAGTQDSIWRTVGLVGLGVLSGIDLLQSVFDLLLWSKEERIFDRARRAAEISPTLTPTVVTGASGEIAPGFAFSGRW